ncbi:restriction endonuclease subunit S [Vagococcus acidifermentans]|uniref:Restriction endonuclease subunit S n=1 Tax=Vagococcus acidifermentans TaxID=564710 RepID=A0A430AR58_9ENTE|nr:restriction endonuclease subunit S [Vagococcus acidifermentans]RSU10414.1 restriction endonuclease subunit S [Vagococcus acidifermentans]
MKNNKQPAIRFAGFTDDWEQRKLGELADIIGGGTPSTSNSDYWDGDIDWYSPAEIGNQIYLAGSQKKITSEGLAKSSAKVHPVGTILFTSRAGIGNTAILAKEGATNQGFQSILPNKTLLDSYFIFSRTNELKRYGEVHGAGSTFVEVSGKQMAQMPIYVPKLEEQQKIGSFFKQLDDTIALHQQELAILKQTKQGFLQKMFPKKGESVPEIRFPGFTDAWEQRKLGEIFDILDGDRGKNYPGERDFFEVGATLFLDTGNVKRNGFDFSIRKYITEEKDKLLRNGKLALNDFVITSRGTLGNVAYYDSSIALKHPSIRINSAMLILRPMLRKEVLDDYMEAVLRGNVIDSFMKKNHVGSAQPHITKRDFSLVSIDIPKVKEEQQKIGSFFKQLDETIALHQRELELLQETKKAFLQKMFV